MLWTLLGYYFRSTFSAVDGFSSKRTESLHSQYTVLCTMRYTVKFTVYCVVCSTVYCSFAHSPPKQVNLYKSTTRNGHVVVDFTFMARLVLRMAFLVSRLNLCTSQYTVLCTMWYTVKFTVYCVVYSTVYC